MVDRLYVLIIAVSKLFNLCGDYYSENLFESHLHVDVSKLPIQHAGPTNVHQFYRLRLAHCNIKYTMPFCIMITCIPNIKQYFS